MRTAVTAFLFILASGVPVYSEPNPQCGDPSRYAHIAIWIKDTPKARKKAADVLRHNAALDLGPGCNFSRILGGLPPGTKSTLLVRMLPVTKLGAVQRDILDLGTLHYFDAKTDGPSSVSLEAAKFQTLWHERDSSKILLEKLPWTRTLIDAELDRLSPFENTAREVGDKILLNVQLLEEGGDRSQLDPPKQLLAACREQQLSCGRETGEIISQLFDVGTVPSRNELLGAFRGFSHSLSGSIPLLPALLIVQNETAGTSGPLRVRLLTGPGVPKDPPFGPYIDSFNLRRPAFDPIEFRPGEAYFQREVLGVQGTKQVALFEKYHLRRLYKDFFVIINDGWAPRKYFFYGNAPRR